MVWYHDVQLLFGEACYLAEFFLVGVAVECAQVVECLGLEVEKHAGEHLLVDDGGVFHPVGHDVVDVFDEDEVGPLFVEVLDECAVSAGAEDEASVLVAQGLVLLVDGDEVGVVLLFRVGYLEFYAEGALVVLLYFGQFAPERRAVFRRDGEVQVDGAVGGAGIEGAFDDVFFERGALHRAVAVEFEQRFREASVAEVLLFEEEVDDGGVVAALQVVLDVEVGGGHAGFQVVEEREGVDVLQELFHVGEFFLEVPAHAEVGGGEGIEFFEHARGGSRGGHELEQPLPFAERTVKPFVACYLFVVKDAYAAVGGGGCFVEAGLGEALFEVVYLLLYFFNSKTQFIELSQVFIGWFEHHVICVV